MSASVGRNNISEKKDWNTPPKYVKLINEFFGEIDLDPCSNEYSLINSKIKYLLPTDGLKESWNYNKIFVNPPYGRVKGGSTSIYDWIKRGVDAYYNGSEIIYLIPVSTNTSYFKELIFIHASGICFLNDTRLKFWSEGKEDKKGAPMACCFIYFGNNYQKFEESFSASGKCLKINH